MKLFVASDLHSYFTIFHNELKAKGFEENNPDHLLIICGDVFDRGSESVQMYEYLNSLTNVILVRGNHEDLLEEMLIRGYGESHDISNGTTRTVSDLLDLTGTNPDNIYDICKEVKKIVYPFLDKYVTYFETKNYIFVHGWIPCDAWDHSVNKPWYQRNRLLVYNPDWRNSNDAEWYSARWVNGISAGYKNHITEPGKTIVCGHWHCSTGHYLKAVGDAINKNQDPWCVPVSEFGPDAIWEPFVAEGIMAIDRCTAHTGQCNVVVLEDELLDETEK